MGILGFQAQFNPTSISKDLARFKVHPHSFSHNNFSVVFVNEWHVLSIIRMQLSNDMTFLELRNFFHGVSIIMYLSKDEIQRT